MALNSNSLCTLAELKSFMGISLTDTSKDLILEIYVNSVSNTIEKLIGRKILAADYAEKLAGTNTNELIVRNRPINAVTSVKFISDGEVLKTFENTEYEILAEEGILYANRGWSRDGYSSFMSRKVNYPARYIEVVYNAGFTEIPSDLKLICMQICADTYALDNSQGNTLKSYKISDVEKQWRDEVKFTDMQLRIINSYKGMHF